MRGIVLRDAAARRWFRERGLHTTGDQPLYLAANELRTSSFGFARVWHSAAVIVTETSGKNARLFIQVEGDSVISSGQGEGTLRPGGIAVLPAHTAFSISSVRNVGRYETFIDLATFSDQISERLRAGVVYERVSSAYRDILIGTGNSALNGRAAPSDKGYAGFVTAVSSLASAMLIEEVESRETMTASRTEDLFFIAHQTIKQNASNPDFSVSQLARTLGITTRRLQMIFSTSGSTPKQAITVERLRRAMALLDQDDRNLRLRRDDVARMSGFRNRAALRRALDS